MFIQGKWTESRQTRIFQSESEVHFKPHNTKKYWRCGFSLPTNAEDSGKFIDWYRLDNRVPSELSSSHKTMESLLTGAEDKTGEFTTEEHANPKVMRLSNQNMVEALPISADKTGEITTEGQEVLNELSSNQKTREGSPTVEK